MEVEPDIPPAEASVLPGEAELLTALTSFNSLGLSKGALFLSELNLLSPTSKGDARPLSSSQVNQAPTAAYFPCSPKNPHNFLVLMRAKCHIANRQYQQAITVLDAEPRSVRDPVAVFFKAHAGLCECERMQRHASANGDLLTDPKQERHVAFERLLDLAEWLEPFFVQNRLDGPTLWVYGRVLEDLELPDEAFDAFSKAVSACPLLWPAWEGVVRLCVSARQGKEGGGKRRTKVLECDSAREFGECFGLPACIVRDLSFVSVLIDTGRFSLALKEAERLESLLPQAAPVFSLKARALQGLGFHRRAVAAFRSLLEKFPLRLEDLGAFSHSLRLVGEEAELKWAAQQAARIDRFSPAALLAAAEVLSLRGVHLQAAALFKRAFMTDPGKPAGVLVLCAHELIEAKRFAGALEVFRLIAEDLEPQNALAWLGIGQAFELAHRHEFCLFFYRRAATLTPTDGHVFHALGECLAKIGRLREAARHLEKAFSLLGAQRQFTDRRTAAFRLFQIHREEGRMTEAAKWARTVFLLHVRGDEKNAPLTRVPEPTTQQPGPVKEVVPPSGDLFGERLQRRDVVEVAAFLLAYHRDREETAICAEWCVQLLDSCAPEREVARHTLAVLEAGQTGSLAPFSCR
uniref:Uncharacterized protein n=1 Tax=Chromera velia CCMP2878 TaxID=1169474 RepID=A0A0G4G0W5_9ALVE|eukprot:Cvel_19594.t1-p1 / transcript=Cvel_19594.t1 / gene=Cvel_19594 / organism=Chromera_velia_CCMP2878 / gene_product=Cell division cycle protein 23 homolog, putative / transcript_product=Cell division cycle protein 23 homolog, putative / location=Cvel_scaffold1703:3230-6578(-) / protein_length=632 / sequence_SO=supercontig / SO=protein_coding / is_pseudo=false